MAPVIVSPMLLSEVDSTAQLIGAVVSPLTYYSEAARKAELLKYTPLGLISLVHEDEASVLLARFEGVVAGFCISKYDDGVIWLAWFGVHERFRGHRVAESLLLALDRRTRMRGCSKIWCDTRTSNVKSQRALERAGFSRVCALYNHWYGQDFFLWDKILPPQL